MKSINGMPRREVLGKTVFEVIPGFADHPVGHAWREALAGRRAELREFRFFSTARDAEVVYDADFTPLYDEAGTLIGAVCMLRETTERLRMEQMLRQSQKMEAVAQLTGGVAHDFNNLLTAVIGCLDLILREKNSQRVAALAQAALRSADRGARLTQQLLAFARRQALRPVIADLNALLADIAEILRRAAGDSVDLTIEYAAGPLCCEVDPAQFEAAAINLVTNARDAMPRGGRLNMRTSLVEMSDVPIDIELQPNDYIAFSVQDSGEGMTQEIAARAFEPFYTTKEIGKGTGLGLSMVYGFARQSGGGVRLDSAPGSGTSVTLYLPRVCAPAIPSDGIDPTDERSRGVRSVLVVEDDDEVRQVSVAMLRELGYRVLVAKDGREALNVLQNSDDIDLLLTDLVMPGGISGTALARQAQLMRPDLRVLLTTGYAGAEQIEAEGIPIIFKPYRPSELGRMITNLLGSEKPN